ncbi:MAG TPA: hypothetical protein VGH10_11735 [Actinomycetota bacterium]|jgi:hypothetical protein
MRRARLPFVWLFLFFVYFFLVTIPNAHAYLDPGTGSYVFQVVMGALLAAAVAVKVFWVRLWGFVTRRSKNSSTTPDAAPTEPAAKEP